MPAREPDSARSTYIWGVTAVLIAGICLSSGGLLLRHVEAADGWQVLFYRSISFAATVLVYLLVRYRGRVARPVLTIGWQGSLVALALGVGFSCYLFGLVLTSVANVAFIVSTAPFFAAVLGWFVLRERIARSTWLAILMAIAGIGIMIADGLSAGGFLGNLVALGAPTTAAFMIVMIRRYPAIDMMPATCLGGLVAAMIAATQVDAWLLSAHDLLLSILLGTVQVGVGFILITIGSRYVPAAQVALLMLGEAVLSPIWVWLFVAEVPTTLALVGGAIVLAAVTGQAIAGIRSERSGKRPTSASAPAVTGR